MLGIQYEKGKITAKLKITKPRFKLLEKLIKTILVLEEDMVEEEVRLNSFQPTITSITAKIECSKGIIDYVEVALTSDAKKVLEKIIWHEYGLNRDLNNGDTPIYLTINDSDLTAYYVEYVDYLIDGIRTRPKEESK